MIAESYDYLLTERHSLLGFAAVQFGPDQYWSIHNPPSRGVYVS